MTVAVLSNHDRIAANFWVAPRTQIADRWREHKVNINSEPVAIHYLLGKHVPLFHYTVGDDEAVRSSLSLWGQGDDVRGSEDSKPCGSR
jgi:hypothetical protein